MDRYTAYRVELPAVAEADYWKNPIYEELKAGRARFGFSSFNDADLRQLQLKVRETEWVRLTRDERRCWSNCAFLLAVEPGDFFIFVNMPRYGDCTVVRVAGPYGFSKVWDEEQRGDFRHFMPCRFMETLERDDPRINPQLAARLRLKGAWKRLAPEECLDSFLSALREGTPPQDPVERLEGLLAKALAREARSGGSSRKLEEQVTEKSLRASLATGYALALDDVLAALRGNFTHIETASGPEGILHRFGTGQETDLPEARKTASDSEDEGILLSWEGVGRAARAATSSARRQSAAAQAPEELGEETDTEKRQRPARCYPALTIPIRDLYDPAIEGYVSNISEKGVRITGIKARMSERRSFVINWSAFGESYEVQFGAVCRWSTESAIEGLASGFEILRISADDRVQLGQLINSMTYCDLTSVEIFSDFQSGMSNADLMEKYGLSEDELLDVFRKLTEHQAAQGEADQPPETRIEADESEAKPAGATYCSPFMLTIYDLDHPHDEAYVRKLTDQDLQIVGIQCPVGQEKTLLIQADEFNDVEPFSFNAVCRRISGQGKSNRPIADFHITLAKEFAAAQLRKVIHWVGLCGLTDWKSGP